MKPIGASGLTREHAHDHDHDHAYDRDLDHDHDWDNDHDHDHDHDYDHDHDWALRFKSPMRPLFFFLIRFALFVIALYWYSVCACYSPMSNDSPVSS